MNTLRALCRDELSRCERKAGGSWPAFLALAGLSHSLARALPLSTQPSDGADDAASDAGSAETQSANKLLPWAVLLAYLSSSSTDKEVRGLR